jgi:hypothetical protein
MLPPTGASRLRPLGQRYSTFAVLATLSAGRDAWTPPLALFFPRGRRQERRAGGAWQPAQVQAGPPFFAARRWERNGSYDGGRGEAGELDDCEGRAVDTGQGGAGEDEGEGEPRWGEGFIAARWGEGFIAPRHRKGFDAARGRGPEVDSTPGAHATAACSRARLPRRHGSAHGRGPAGRQGRRGRPQDGGRTAEALARSLRRTLVSVTESPAYWCRSANPAWLQVAQMSKLRHQ